MATAAADGIAAPIRLAHVLQIAHRERTAGVEAVPARIDGRLRALDDGTPQVRVARDIDIEAAIPRLDARLHGRTDEDAIRLGSRRVRADRGDGAVADRRNAQAHPEAAAGLPALAHAHVLQAGDVQVAPDIGRHAVGFDRRPIEREIAAAGDVHGVAAGDLGGGIHWDVSQ